MLPTIYVSFWHSSDESRLHVRSFQTFLSIGPGPRQAKEPFACRTACTRGVGGRLTKGHPGVSVPAGPGSRSPPAKRQWAATSQALPAPVGEARGNKPAGACRPRPAVRPARGRRRRAGSGRPGPGRGGGGLSRKLPPRRPRPFRRQPGAGGRHFRPGDGVVAVAAAAGEKEGAREPPPPPPPPRGWALRHRHLALLPRRQVRWGGAGCGGRSRSRSRPPRGGRASSRSGARCPGPPRDAGESRPGVGTSPRPRNRVPGRCARLAGVCAARRGLRAGSAGDGREGAASLRRPRRGRAASSAAAGGKPLVSSVCTKIRSAVITRVSLAETSVPRSDRHPVLAGCRRRTRGLRVPAFEETGLPGNEKSRLFLARVRSSAVERTTWFSLPAWSRRFRSELCKFAASAAIAEGKKKPR